MRMPTPAPVFVKGDRVVVIADDSNKYVRRGIYTIVQLLPRSREGFEYRAKNQLDPHERVFAEHEIRRERLADRP